MSGLSDPQARPPAEVLRERCAAAGLLVWRVDAKGQIQHEPVMGEMAGLFLKSSVFAALIEQAAGSWHASAQPEPIRLWPGCSLLGLPTRARGRVSGYLVVLLLEQQALEFPELRRLVERASLDPDAVAEALGTHINGGPDEHLRLSALLGPMYDDIERSQLDGRTIDGFTTHLSDAYEQMALLHELGRSMTRFRQAGDFFSTVLDRLADTLQFRWFCVFIAEDDDLPPELNGQAFSHGTQQIRLDALQRTLWDRTRGCDESSQVLSLQSVGIHGGGQLVVQPIIRDGALRAILIAGGKRGDDPQVSSYDTHLISSVAGYVGTFLDNARLEVRRNEMFVGSIQALTAMVDAKDHYTLGHSERVALLGSQFAEVLGLGSEVVERIHLSGLLHDVGKVGVPEAVLTKCARLTDEEFAIIKRHPQHGYDMLKGIPSFEDILDGVLTHHERWDGRGYPSGLAGEDIPLFGRILALADTFDAMSSTRAYREALPREKVIEEIRSCAGKQFDPDMAPLFAEMDFGPFDELLATNARRSQQFKAA